MYRNVWPLLALATYRKILNLGGGRAQWCGQPFAQRPGRLPLAQYGDGHIANFFGRFSLCSQMRNRPHNLALFPTDLGESQPETLRPHWRFLWWPALPIEILGLQFPASYRVGCRHGQARCRCACLAINLASWLRELGGVTWHAQPGNLETTDVPGCCRRGDCESQRVQQFRGRSWSPKARRMEENVTLAKTSGR